MHTHIHTHIHTHTQTHTHTQKHTLELTHDQMKILVNTRFLTFLKSVILNFIKIQ